MIYDIYDASIHSYPAGRLSDGVSFDRKILEIRQIPGGFLFPRISCHFEFIYLLSGTSRSIFFKLFSLAPLMRIISFFIDKLLILIYHQF